MGRMSRDRGGVNEILKADFEIPASAANVLVVASDARSNLAVAEAKPKACLVLAHRSIIFHEAW